MITLFLIGLVAAVATIFVIKVAHIGFQWLRDYVEKKLANREKHKVAFVSTREVVDEYLKEQTSKASISEAELERICETPYIAADVDENGEIGDYEGFTTPDFEPQLAELLKTNDGMLIIGE